MLDTDAAWAAGFLDGEGSFRIQLQATGSINIQVTAVQVSDVPLRKLESLFGGYISFKQSKRPRENDTYVWALYKRADVVSLLDAITPYIVLKTAQVKLQRIALELTKTSHKGYVLTEDMIRDRIALTEEMHTLNRKGRAE